MKESVGILIVARSTNNFLLLHRSEKPVVWSILTGTMDVPGETPVECVRREIKEEINLDPSLVKNIELLDTITNDYGLFHVFIGYVDEEMDLDLKLDENNNFLWCNEETLPKPLHKRWINTFQLVKPVLDLRENIKKELKTLIHEQRGVGNRTRKKENPTR